MEVRTQGQDGRKVASVNGCLEEIAKILDAAQQEWVNQLRNEPHQFAQIEKTIHETLQRVADQVAASVLAEATAASPALEAAKKK